MGNIFFITSIICLGIYLVLKMLIPRIYEIISSLSLGKKNYTTEEEFNLLVEQKKQVIKTMLATKQMNSNATQTSFGKISDVALNSFSSSSSNPEPPLKKYIRRLFNQAQHRSGLTLDQVSIKIHSSNFDVARAFEFLFLKETGQKEEGLYAYLLENKKEATSELSRLEASQKEVLIDLVAKKFEGKTENDILAEVSQEAIFFHALTELHPLNKNHLEKDASRVFGLSLQSSMAEVHKRYKELAKTRHPDRFHAKKIPKKYFDLATRNFAIIGEAYEILSKIAEKKQSA